MVILLNTFLCVVKNHFSFQIIIYIVSYDIFYQPPCFKLSSWLWFSIWDHTLPIVPVYGLFFSTTLSQVVEERVHRRLYPKSGFAHLISKSHPIDRKQQSEKISPASIYFTLRGNHLRWEICTFLFPLFFVIKAPVVESYTCVYFLYFLL